LLWFIRELLISLSFFLLMSLIIIVDNYWKSLLNFSTLFVILNMLLQIFLQLIIESMNCFQIFWWFILAIDNYFKLFVQCYISFCQCFFSRLFFKCNCITLEKLLVDQVWQKNLFEKCITRGKFWIRKLNFFGQMINKLIMHVTWFHHLWWFCLTLK